jgi:hypothetical protein
LLAFVMKTSIATTPFTRSARCSQVNRIRRSRTESRALGFTLLTTLREPHDQQMAMPHRATVIDETSAYMFVAHIRLRHLYQRLLPRGAFIS